MVVCHIWLIFRYVPNYHIIIIWWCSQNIWYDWVPSTCENFGCMSFTLLYWISAILVINSKYPVFTASSKLSGLKWVPSNPKHLLWVFVLRKCIYFLSVCRYWEKVTITVHWAYKEKIRIMAVPAHWIKSKFSLTLINLSDDFSFIVVYKVDCSFLVYCY